jgi:hypothetical protein
MGQRDLELELEPYIRQRPGGVVAPCVGVRLGPKGGGEEVGLFDSISFSVCVYMCVLI